MPCSTWLISEGRTGNTRASERAGVPAKRGYLITRCRPPRRCRQDLLRRGYFWPHGTESILELSKAPEKGEVDGPVRYPPNVTLHGLFPHLRSQPPCSLYCSIFQCPTPESPSLFSATGSKPNLGQCEWSSRPKGSPHRHRGSRSTTKVQPARDGVVLLIRCAQPTITICPSCPDNVSMYAFNAPKDEEIVDTNGARDTFAGRLLGALAVGKRLDEAIEVGHTLGTGCATQVGLQSSGRRWQFYSKNKVYLLPGCIDIRPQWVLW